MRHRAWAALGGALLTAACAGARPAAEDTTAASSKTPSSAAPSLDTGRREPDRTRPAADIATLEREARALASTVGCPSAASCRAAPVGWRACGGPRTYLAYCAATTDTTALFTKLRELERVERESITRQGGMSTCEFRTPPRLTLAGGRCVQSIPTLGEPVPQ